MPLEDYNRLMNTNETLEKDEALVHCTRQKYGYETIRVGNGQELSVKRVLDSFPEDEMGADQIISAVFVVVSDFNEYIAPLTELTYLNENKMLSLYWIHGFDLDAPDEQHIAVRKQMLEELQEVKKKDDGVFKTYMCYSTVLERLDFYSSFGGLFFLGIMLSIVFISAAVLIIYYKQISEGYEDQSRFEIMQKVGMTKKDIRKSINSQILTVFFMPLVFAGLHLAFAFPLIWKILQLFNLRNLTLLIIVTVCCYLMFGLFYALVYRVTSSTYYKIVSGINGQNV
jgi:putative ABC transport system permease protein